MSTPSLFASLIGFDQNRGLTNEIQDSIFVLLRYIGDIHRDSTIWYQKKGQIYFFPDIEQSALCEAVYSSSLVCLTFLVL